MIKAYNGRKAKIAMKALFAVLFGGVLTTANAASEQAHSSHWRLGMAVASADAAYKGRNSETFVVPVIGYEGKRLYFRGIELGYRLYQHQGTELAAVVSVAPFRFEPKKNRIEALQQLDARDFRVESGLKYSKRTRFGRFSAQSLVNIRDFSTGYRSSVGYFYSLSKQPRRWQFGPRIEVNYISGSFADYYYAVSAAEAERSGLNEYNSNDSWNTTLGFEGYMRLNQRWSIAGSINRTFLGSEISNSPMTAGSHTTSAFIFLSYQL